MKTMFITILLLATIVFNLKAQHQDPRSDYWEVIAKSSDIHIINSNDLKNYLLDMEGSVRNAYYYYHLPILETLKGPKMNIIKINVYLRQDFIDYVKILPENTRLVGFFTNLYARFRRSGEDEYNNVIAGKNYNEGIILYTAGVYTEIVNEIKKQQLILNERLYESFLRDEAMDRKIKGLIDELIIEEKEMAAFDELLKIGRNAVPYIILHMDDYRELPIKYARLTNDHPDAWESIVQYRPELIIDTLQIILLDLTGNSFGHTWTDGTNAERQRALDGWRVFLYYNTIGT
jgi:hypothetical protein